MFDLKKLGRVLDAYTQVCEAQAAESGTAFKQKDVARRLGAGTSQQVQFSKFLKKVRDGQNPTADLVNRVFKAYRSTFRDLFILSGSPKDPEGMIRLEEDRLRRQFYIFGRNSPLVQDDSSDFVPLSASDFMVVVYEKDNRTRVLSAHDPEPFRNYFHLLKEEAEETGDAFDALCKYAEAEFVETRPNAAELSSFPVLFDSSLFDYSDWVGLDDGDPVDRIWKEPFQASYQNRIIRIRVPDPAPQEIGFESNTSGFGVFPVPDETIPVEERPRFCVQLETRMTEMANNGRTTYLIFPIPPDRAGKEMDFHIRCVFINDLQDQLHKRDANGDLVTMDWSGKRLTPDTMNADLAVVLPLTHGIDEWEFRRRPESASRDHVVEIDQRETQFYPGPQRKGSGVFGSKAIWNLPQVDEPTIFSFHWSWDWNG